MEVLSDSSSCRAFPVLATAVLASGKEAEGTGVVAAFYSLFVEVSNWSRRLTDLLGLDADQSAIDYQNSIEDDDRKGGDETTPSIL